MDRSGLATDRISDHTMKTLEESAHALCGSKLLPRRVAPASWATTFFAGSVVSPHGLSRLGPLLGDECGPIYELLLVREDASWQLADHATEEDGYAAKLWLPASGAWLVRLEPDWDVCLYACSANRCLPAIDDIFWLSAGGALSPGGFESELPSPASIELKKNYDASAMRLCDEQSPSTELLLAIAGAEELGGGGAAVPTYRRLWRLLHRWRSLPLPPAAVNTILDFVPRVGFWPEGDERNIWSDELLSQHDDLRDTIAAEWRDRLAAARSALRIALRR